MKTYVIGDIHGCFDEFQQLLDKIQPDLATERLILLGDYIDRGNKSYEMVRTLMSLQAKYGREKIVLLRGNHEQMAIDYYGEGDASYLYNGGDLTMRSFQQHRDSLENYLDFFRQMPVYLEDEQYIYVHGGLRPGIQLVQQKEQDMLWIREEFLRSPNTTGKTVIFGHTPTTYFTDQYLPFRINNNIALDTGCVFGGRLSALEIDHGSIRKIYQAQHKRTYEYEMAI